MKTQLLILLLAIVLLSCTDSPEKKEATFLWNISGVWENNDYDVHRVTTIDCRTNKMYYNPYGNHKYLLTPEHFDAENHQMRFNAYDSTDSTRCYKFYVRQVFDKDNKSFYLHIAEGNNTCSLSFVRRLDE